MVDYEPLSRKQPYWKAQDQPWAESHIRASHLDALLRYGEFVMFVLLWRSQDFEDGLVGHCPVCVLGDRLSAGYGDRTGDPDCLACHGTSFEGGWRARIVRPIIISDRDVETRDDRRTGETESERLSLQTTSDFYIRTGDLMIRSDGRRYLMSQMEQEVIRSGFHSPRQAETTGGQVGSVTLVSDVGSSIYRFPPEQAAVTAALESAAMTRHLVARVGFSDEVRGPLVPPSA